MKPGTTQQILGSYLMDPKTIEDKMGLRQVGGLECRS